MTRNEAIAELVRIWHSPHLDLILKARLGEVIETLKEKNQSDSLVTDSSDVCKESESKLDLISRAEAVALVNRAIRGIGDKDVQECLFDGLRKQMWALPSAICDDCIWRVCNYNKIDWEMVDTMAEPKTGEWIQDDDYICDQCGYHMTDLISRQDAIEAIEEIAWYHQNRNREMVSGANSDEDQAWYKAQDIYTALEALPSAEPVIHGRLIDADALSEKLCKTTIFVKDGEVFQRMINDAPTISAEPKTGEWINKDLSVLGITYECSNCGRDCVSAVSYDIKGNEWRYNYCPNCGARMDKGGDSE